MKLPHPNWSDQMNHDVIQSEIEGGVFLNSLPVNTSLRVQTQNRAYTIEKIAENEYMIVGHPKYCPVPVKAYIHGSTFGGSMIKVGFIGRGMHLEFHTEEHWGRIATSRISDIIEVK